MTNIGLTISLFIATAGASTYLLRNVESDQQSMRAVTQVEVAATPKDPETSLRKSEKPIGRISKMRGRSPDSSSNEFSLQTADGATVLVEVANLSRISRESAKEGVSSYEIVEWRGDRVGLSQQMLSGFLKAGEPDAIVYQRKGVTHILEHPRKTLENQDGKLLILSDRESRELLHQEREDAALSASEGALALPGGAQAAAGGISPGEPLGTKQFVLSEFMPGFVKNSSARVPHPKSPQTALLGPDFHLAEVEDIELQNLRARVISFGDKGEMTFEIVGGELVDRPGNDFVIYENGFQSTTPGFPDWVELALVGVSENRNGPYKWFKCMPSSGDLFGCAGAVFAGEGGDRFDLAQVGATRARYIKIRDTGTNLNYGLFTEGFDIDSIDLLHAFKTTSEE